MFPGITSQRNYLYLNPPGLLLEGSQTKIIPSCLSRFSLWWFYTSANWFRLAISSPPLLPHIAPRSSFLLKQWTDVLLPLLQVLYYYHMFWVGTTKFIPLSLSGPYPSLASDPQTLKCVGGSADLSCSQILNICRIRKLKGRWEQSAGYYIYIYF